MESAKYQTEKGRIVQVGTEKNITPAGLLASGIRYPSTGSSQTCGNNLKEGSEVCDGTALNSQTCVTQLGAGSTGNLSCNPGCSAFVTTACVAPYSIPTSGLVAYWKFDEGSGTTATDSSGSNNNGTWNGTGTHYAAGKVGSYAGQFNGSNDYVSTALTNFPSGNTSRTVSLWFKASSITDSWIFDYGAKSDYQEFGLGIKSNGVLMRFWGLGDTGISEVPTLNTWYMVTVTYDGSIGRIYLDGGRKYVEWSVSSLNTQLTTSGIGRRINTYNYFNGTIDDIAVYNRALSSTEILAIYNGQK
jgi:hypothetical protein